MPMRLLALLPSKLQYRSVMRRDNGQARCGSRLGFVDASLAVLRLCIRLGGCCATLLLNTHLNRRSGLASPLCPIAAVQGSVARGLKAQKKV